MREMDKQELALVIEEMLKNRPKIPQCCRACIHFESEWDEWRDKTYYFCNLNIWFPTKKKTCKKQRKR